MTVSYRTYNPRTIGTCALKAEPEQARPQLRLVEPTHAETAFVSEPQRKGSAGIAGFVAAAFIGVFFALALFVPSYIESARAHEALSSVDTRVASVESGESLWTIAEEAQIPGCRTQDVVEWLKATNGLSGSGVTAGQKLTVPVAR